ncbi:MAG: penicillin-binding protein 1A, partial [Thiothrix sp.]
RDKLSTYPILGGLYPALVLKTSSNSAELLVGETIIKLGFEAVQWAREFKSADRRGSVPRRVSDVLSPGDIVRVRPTNNEKTAWTLSQVPAVGAALISIDSHDGAVRAVMGGFDFDYSKFNRATQALRQPGSSFKPVVYAAALSQGFTPTSIVNDAPITIPGSHWRPENFGGKYIGPTTLREALAKSRNLVSIRLLRSVGIEYTIDFATKFGFPRENLPRNLTLALGTNMTTPLEMATAYAAFANGGFRVEPYFITKIEDRNHNVLFEAKPVRVCGDDGWQCKDANGNIDPALNMKVVASDKPVWETELVTGNPLAAKRIMTARTNYQIVEMMRGVTQFGTAARASKVLNRTDIAGKTGTTNDYKDAWFCGFTPDVVSVAWVGFDDMSKLGEGETATNLALPMWIDFMHRVLEGVPAKAWERPADLKQVSSPSRREIAYDDDEYPTPRTMGSYQDRTVDTVPQRTAPAARPPRAPERLEIPEQLF